MQYILTQEEYDKLKEKATSAIKIDKTKLQNLCSTIADTMPVDWGWGPEYKKNPRPWGCILTTDQEWYCDSCPVVDICPNQWKAWSK